MCPFSFESCRYWSIFWISDKQYFIGRVSNSVRLIWYHGFRYNCAVFIRIIATFWCLIKIFEVFGKPIHCRGVVKSGKIDLRFFYFYWFCWVHLHDAAFRCIGKSDSARSAWFRGGLDNAASFICIQLLFSIQVFLQIWRSPTLKEDVELGGICSKAWFFLQMLPPSSGWSCISFFLEEIWNRFGFLSFVMGKTALPRWVKIGVSSSLFWNILESLSLLFGDPSESA